VVSSLLFLAASIGSFLIIANVHMSCGVAIKIFDMEYRYACMSTRAFVAQQVAHGLTIGAVGQLPIFGCLHCMAMLVFFPGALF
jgi:hypothetical protein